MAVVFLLPWSLLGLFFHCDVELWGELRRVSRAQ